MKNSLKGSPWLAVGFIGLFVSQGRGNEALDLLEGKITEDEVTVTELLQKEDADEEGAAAEEEQKKTLVDDRDYSSRWKNRLAPLGMVYENETNPVVQRVAIDGLAEWGIANGDIDPKDGASQKIDDSQLKRVRLGGMMRAFYNTDLEGRVVGDGDGYQGIDTLKATVQVNEALKVEAGKFRPPFSQEYRQDPNVRIAPGLSPIVAQVAPANTVGVRVSAENGPWEMGLGWFSGKQDQNIPELGGGFVLANLSYTFDGEKVVDNSDEDAVTPPGHQRWHLDYLYNTSEDVNGSVPNGYKHLLSTGIEVSSGNFDFGGDFIVANGDVDTAWGMTLTGRYWILEDALRFVGRYNYADTDDAGGLSVGYGVPGALGDSTQPLLGYSTVLSGDEYHSFYAGLDWHFVEEYLMLSTGLELKLLKDETNGDTSSLLWHTGGRVAF
ncbi:porin [Roseibacillus persicicus]|uniref:porin n=1 Tax=Roseibacillus persicicus TaxID=454148 RepID=UPI00398AD9C5